MAVPPRSRSGRPAGLAHRRRRAVHRRRAGRRRPASARCPAAGRRRRCRRHAITTTQHVAVPARPTVTSARRRAGRAWPRWSATRTRRSRRCASADVDGAAPSRLACTVTGTGLSAARPEIAASRPAVGRAPAGCTPRTRLRSSVRASFASAWASVDAWPGPLPGRRRIGPGPGRGSWPARPGAAGHRRAGRARSGGAQPPRTPRPGPGWSRSSPILFGHGSARLPGPIR